MAALAIASALAGALTSCTGDDGPPEPHWQEASLPLPPGPPGRIALREATRCGEAWYAVGGIFLDQPIGDQDTRPAAWRSTDGRRWGALRIDAHTFWGQRAILASVACAHGMIAAVGARSGGAHGNPRVTTFFEDATGLHDVEAPFSQYGGEQATNVGPIAGGPDGWLITGNRTSGPAVWTSPTARTFTLHEDVPGLADDERLAALAQDAVWDPTGAGQWVVVGGGSPPSLTLDRQPAAWASPDGSTWTREQVPSSAGLDDLERAVATDDGIVAVGLRGDRFGVWQRRNGRWRAGPTFGRIPSDASRSPFVAALAAAGDDLWATASDGARYSLWRRAHGEWRRVALPGRAPATGGDHTLSVAAAAAGVLLVSDDGERSRLWLGS